MDWESSDHTTTLSSTPSVDSFFIQNSNKKESFERNDGSGLQHQSNETIEPSNESLRMFKERLNLLQHDIRESLTKPNDTRYDSNDDIGGDNEPVDPSDVGEMVNSTIISVPTIYVSRNETTHPDASVDNLRVIDQEVLFKLISRIIKMERNNYNQQLDLCSQLMNESLVPQGTNDYVYQMMKLINMVCHTSKELDLDDEFIDSTTNGISFDVIRHYVNNKTHGLLESYDAVCWNGCYFYSQLSNDAEIKQARVDNNDTDLNRMRYALLCFQRSALFHPDRFYNKTVDMINIGLFYLCLIKQSRPILNMACNDSYHNILSYMCDMIIRTRVISAWQRRESSVKLLADLGQNYDSANTLVALCRLKDPRDRAMYTLNTFSRHNELKDVLSSFSYDDYIEILESTKISIQNRDYYQFDHDFLLKIVNIQGLRTLNERLSDIQDKNL